MGEHQKLSKMADTTGAPPLEYQEEFEIALNNQASRN